MDHGWASQDVLRPGTGGSMHHPDVRELRLGASSASLPVARDVVGRAAAAAGLDAEAVELARLAASEVVTNALVHGAPPFRLRVEIGPRRMRTAVADGSDREPVETEADDAATRGRGLAIVAQIADRWGWDRRPEGGKFVWFELEG